MWQELTLSPETAELATEVRPERRKRSIYEAVVYDAQVLGKARFVMPEGGYFLWVELPEGCDALALAQRAIAEGISVSPGPIFSPTGAFGNCVRINCGHPMDTRVAVALRRVGELAMR